MGANLEAIGLLESIDASLKKLVSMMAAQQRVEITDGDLDGKYGDPKIRVNPRDWTGDSMKGRTMSECSPEFLDIYAKALDYFAQRAEANNETYNGQPTAPRDREHAAKARAWAKRKRDGWVRPAGYKQAAGVPPPQAGPNGAHHWQGDTDFDAGDGPNDDDF